MTALCCASNRMQYWQQDTLKAFVAGALLPTIGLVWLWTRQKHDESFVVDSDDEDEDPQHPTAPSDWGYPYAPYKMILAVNTDLSMGKGKIAAQCGHASVGCYRLASRKVPQSVAAWNYTGCAKIAVKCSEAEYESLMAKCNSQGIPYYLVEDAGRTQIAAGSKTVLAMFAPVSILSNVTNHLKLL